MTTHFGDEFIKHIKQKTNKEKQNNKNTMPKRNVDMISQDHN